MSKLLVVNGPNLNLLGKREPDLYGHKTLDQIEESMQLIADKAKIQLICHQSNSEGEIIDFIQKEANGATGMIINPGAYTHYSFAIRDAIAAVGIRTVEVHLSNLHSRERFRRRSVISPVCVGQITGLGDYSYIAALNYFIDNPEQK